MDGLEKNETEEEIRGRFEDTESEHDDIIKINKIYDIREYIDIMEKFMEIDKDINKIMNDEDEREEYEELLLKKREI